MGPEDEELQRHEIPVDVPGLDEVMRRLHGYLSPDTVPRWLHGSNGHLGSRRPISLLREGRLDEVLAATDAEKGGSYT